MDLAVMWIISEALDVIQILLQYQMDLNLPLLEWDGLDPTKLSEIRWIWFHKGHLDGLEHVTQIDLSEKMTRLLSDGLDRGVCLWMDLSAWDYPKKQGIYSDARCSIPGVTTVKQSGEGPPLSDTYSDTRCHNPGVTKEKQIKKELFIVSRIIEL